MNNSKGLLEKLMKFHVLELKGTEKEVAISSNQNTKERSRFFMKSKSLSEPEKNRQNSLSHMEATKINPRTHSTKGISKVSIKYYTTIDNCTKLNLMCFVKIIVISLK